MLIDYEVANWFTATHPNSPFRRNLMVTRVNAAGALWAARQPADRAARDGGVEQRQLDAAQLENALADIFGLPVAAAWRPVIERAVAATPAA